jgi:hypothetical protein
MNQITPQAPEYPIGAVSNVNESPQRYLQLCIIAGVNDMIIIVDVHVIITGEKLASVNYSIAKTML